MSGNHIPAYHRHRLRSCDSVVTRWYAYHRTLLHELQAGIHTYDYVHTICMQRGFFGEICAVHCDETVSVLDRVHIEKCTASGGNPSF